jgi:hypothetical protein
MNSALEQALDKLPQEVSDALLQWRKATLDRERVESRIYSRLKMEDPSRTATEMKHLLNADQERYEAVLQEITFESVYKLKEESLMAKKKEASLRTAF